MKLIIVALDLPSLRYVAGIAAAGGFELVGVMTDGWSPDNAAMPAPLIDDPAAHVETRDCSLFIAGDAGLLNQRRLACLLRHKTAGSRMATLVAKDADVHAAVRLRENVLVGYSARVGKGSDLGVNTVIGDRATIGSGARIGHSAWIGRDSVIGDDCRIGRNCVLGDGVRLAPGCSLEPWTVLAGGYRLDASPGRTIFVDDLFRSAVVMRGRAVAEDWSK